jgi:succinate dehydrogenase / fumarate reductase cytochrome b subunit
VILLFVAFHLAQLTFGATLPSFEPADPYHNLVTALWSWPVALGHIVVGAAVAAHLLVGVWTGMRSLRLVRPGTETLARVLAPTVAVAIFLGIGAVPIAVLLGVLS